MLLLKATIINCSRRYILPSFSSTYRSIASIASKETMSFEEDKQKFLRMSLEEKKKYYPLPIITLDQMCTWQEYWEKNNSSKTLETTDKVDRELAKKVSVWHGDISALRVDAIVNAANSSLLGGGGVDGAIHRAAGKLLRKECETLGGCKVGEAKITGAYELPAKYVIHTVGPQSEKPELLKKCYENSLQLAKENKLRTVAFPCISTGIYGYPQKSAAKVALSVVMNFLLENMDAIDRVIFCVFLTSDKKIYDDLLQQYFGLE